MKVGDGDRLALHALEFVQATVQRAGLAGAIELFVGRGRVVAQALFLELAQRLLTTFAQLVDGLVAGDVDHPGQGGRQMGLVARSVVPDPHKAFL